MNAFICLAAGLDHNGTLALTPSSMKIFSSGSSKLRNSALAFLWQFELLPALHPPLDELLILERKRHSSACFCLAINPYFSGLLYTSTRRPKSRTLGCCVRFSACRSRSKSGFSGRYMVGHTPYYFRHSFRKFRGRLRIKPHQAPSVLRDMGCTPSGEEWRAKRFVRPSKASTSPIIR